MDTTPGDRVPEGASGSGLPAGAWVDRVRRRPLLIVCDLVSAALYASVPVAAWLDVLTLAQLLVVAVMCGVSARGCASSAMTPICGRW